LPHTTCRSFGWNEDFVPQHAGQRKNLPVGLR
jgi:hypothetical protein